jgi:hypothetical protein
MCTVIDFKIKANKTERYPFIERKTWVVKDESNEYEVTRTVSIEGEKLLTIEWDCDCIWNQGESCRHIKFIRIFGAF